MIFMITIFTSRISSFVDDYYIKGLEIISMIVYGAEISSVIRYFLPSGS